MVDRIDGGSQFQQSIPQGKAANTGAEGQYQGQKVSHKPDAASMIADAAEEMSFGASEKVEKKLSKRKIGSKGGAKSSAMEQAELYLKKLPDLGGSKKLQQFCDHLKKQGDLSPGQLRQEAGKFFKDSSHQFAALSFAGETIGSEAEQQGLKQNLKTALTELLKEHGPSVRAGMNISETAGRFAEKGLGDIGQLRDFYRETVLKHDGINDTYRDILDNMDYFICKVCRHTCSAAESAKCPACGADTQSLLYNEEEFLKRVDFLLKSVGCDLGSEGSSIEPARLKKVIDDLYQVEVLGNLHRNCKDILAKMQQQFNSTTGTFPPDLIKNILDGMQEQWIREDHILRLVRKIHIPDIEGQIYFVREFKELVRLIPLKIYDDPETRDNFLTAIQDALDSVIEKEEEA